MNTNAPSTAESQPITETIAIDGMSCGHCVAAVRRALEATPGVEVTHVAIGEARVCLDPTRVDRSAIEATIEEAGYTVRRDSWRGGGDHAPLSA
ncbi:MAG TPA: cation transporter [Rubricoccaceae bacterium]|jgi:copper chaperone CopZ|nr:cation transporter [Rubricoccaceae bacterium]